MTLRLFIFLIIRFFSFSTLCNLPTQNAILFNMHMFTHIRLFFFLNRHNITDMMFKNFTAQIIAILFERMKLLFRMFRMHIFAFMPSGRWE